VQLFVLVPECDCFIGDYGNAMLRDGGPSGVSPSILEEMLFVFKGLNVEASTNVSLAGSRVLGGANSEFS
jgi:hypothetical protein